MLKRLFTGLFCVAALINSSMGQYKSKLSVYFESNRATLDPRAIASLEKFIQNKRIASIHLKGFCDSAGSFEYNDDLALSRVKTVLHFLVSKKIPKESITFQSKGERVLINKGASSQEMALNRRVDLEMVYSSAQKTIAPSAYTASNKKLVAFSGTVTNEENIPIQAELTLSDHLGNELLNTKSNHKGHYNFSTFLNPKGVYSLTFYNDSSFVGEQLIRITDPDQKYSNIVTVLPKLKGGKSYPMKNLNFYGNTFRILPSSIPTLAALNKLMKKNKNLQIEIQGHVNYPLYLPDPEKTKSSAENAPKGYTAAQYSQWLSDQRAKAVYEHLVHKGINNSRMTWLGYSNKRMLYPYAHDEIESALNRRVEIMVVSFE